MQAFKKNIIRIVTLILALQLLNLSIYAQDFTPIFNEAGSDEININETIVEYVVEVVCGHTNAIPEQQPEHKDLHFHKHAGLNKIISTPVSYLTNTEPPAGLIVQAPSNEYFIDRFIGEIRPQPPKTA